MVSLLVATAVLGTPAQNSPLGQISREQLFQEIRTIGFVVLEEKGSTLLVNGKTRVHLGAGMHRADNGALFVGSAWGRLEFDLPKSFPKKELQDWTKQQGIGKSITTGPFLGGRVYVQGWLFTERTSRLELKSNIRELLDACRKVTQLVESRGGKASTPVHSMGKSPYEPDFKLDWIEEEDLDFMTANLKWGRRIRPGGFKFWATGAEPLGVPVYFSGGPRGWQGLSLSSMAYEPKLAGVERYVQIPAKPDWADLFEIRKDYVYIQKSHNFPNGVTVRELENRIMDYARKVKALELF